MINTKKQDNYLIYILLSILTAITFLPLLNIGFTTADDFEYFTTATHIKNWIPDATHYAEYQGRFFFLITKYFYSIPYLIDSPVYFYTITILPLLISFVLLLTFLQRLTQNTSYTQMGTLLLLCFFSVNHSHSAFTSYPFYFTFSFILCLSSLLLLLKYLKNNNYRYLVCSSLLFFITTIFYETYLVYYLLFFLLIVDRYSIKQLLKLGKKPVLQFLKEFGPFLFFCFLYVFIYLLYGAMHEGNYDGNSVKNISIFKAFYNLIAMSIGSLPWANVMEYKTFVSQESLQESTGITMFSLSMGAYIKALIVGFLFAKFAPNITINSSKKQLVTYLLISLLFIALPHLLLVVSEKYNSTLFYTYVSTSFGFLAVVLCFLFLYLLGFLYFSNNEKKLVMYNFLIGCSLALTALYTQYTNEQIAKDLSISKKRFEAVKEISVNQFEDISVLYAKDFYSTSSKLGWGIVQDTAATRFFSQMIDQRIIVEKSYDYLYQQYKNTDQYVGFLFSYQASKTGSTLMVAGKCRGKQLTEKREDLRLDSLFCVQYAISKKFSITILGDSTGRVTLGNDTLKQRDNYHYGNIQYLGGEKMVAFQLKGKDLLPSTLVVSDYLHPETRNIAIGNYSWMYRQWRTLFLYHKIKRDKALMKIIEEDAAKHNISINKSAWNNARWILENMEPYE